MKTPKSSFVDLHERVPKDHSLHDSRQRDAVLEDLRLCIGQQATDSLDYINLLLLLRSLLVRFPRAHTEQQPSNVERNNRSVAFKVAVLAQCLASSDTAAKDLKDRMQGRVANLYAEADAGSKFATNDLSWDYIQPKIPIAASTLTLLSRALTAAQVLGAARTVLDMGFRELYDLLNLLLSILDRAELEREVAREIEREVWSEEESFAELKLENQENIQDNRTPYHLIGIVEKIL